MRPPKKKKGAKTTVDCVALENGNIFAPKNNTVNVFWDAPAVRYRQFTELRTNSSQPQRLGAIVLR